MRGERLEVSADLVADVAICGHTIGADDHEVDHPVLHQMTAGAIGDHGMRHAVMTELPRRERGALIARAGLVDPNMDGMAAVVRQIDRSSGRAPIHRRQPAGIAMGQHVDALTGLLSRRDRLDQRKAVMADTLVDRDVFFGDLARARIGCRGPLRRRQMPQHRAHFIERPFQVDRRRPRRD